MGSDTGAIGTELFMNDSELTQFVTQLLWIVLFTSMPVVLVASVVGVIVSLVQALTQIQDQTLQFMIKLLAIAMAMAVPATDIGNCNNLNGQLPMA
ncbi:Type III secretion inner membrane protein SsaS [Salmonella enterica subsp. enterica serovar Minnesota str. A4-603]|nr:Type III secretion inner membrane protein SsaS [Salmonella enterica subsp. enterica serovar Minnesota str. A4-603]